MTDFISTVIDLRSYREGRRAAAFLLGSMHEPAWLESVRVEIAEDGAARIVVTVLSADPMIRRCLPLSVSKVPVRVVVAGLAGRGAAT